MCCDEEREESEERAVTRGLEGRMEGVKPQATLRMSIRRRSEVVVVVLKLGVHILQFIGWLL